MSKLQSIAVFIFVFGYMWQGSNSLYSPQQFVVEEPRASLVRTFLRSHEVERPGIFSDLNLWMQPIANEERHRQLIKKGDQTRQDQIRAMENMIIRTVRDKKVMNQLIGTVVKEIKDMNRDPIERFEVDQGMAKPAMFSRQLSDQSRSVEQVDEPIPLTSNIGSPDLNSFQSPILSVPMHLLRGV